MGGVVSKQGWWLLGGGLAALLGVLLVALLPARATIPAAAVGTRLEATALPTSLPASIAPAPLAPTATAAVLARRVGSQAFGRPPALALPGDGGFGSSSGLVFERAADLGALPTSADVHRLTWPSFSSAAVRDLSTRLGLGGSVEAVGPGAFQVQDGTRGRLFVAHGRILYSRAGGRPSTVTVDLAGAAESARRWLVERRLLPAGAAPPRARLLDEAGLILVTFLPTTPQPLVTPEPSITVTVDGNGAVYDLDILWPAAQEISAYPLTGLTAAWEAVRRGDAFVEIDPAAGVPPGRRLEGQARLTRATLGWALAGGTDADEGAFLEPVYIFSGMVRLAGHREAIPCQVYVPALLDYPWPRG